ncbi:FAD-dependent oxidoreductase [Nocardia sp. NPDC003482]
MPHVITGDCCADARCVRACPLDCIHPRPDEPGFGTTDLLHIDPSTCIDCGACADACPAAAIRPGSRLSADQRPYQVSSAAYFAHRPAVPPPKPAPPQLIPPGRDLLTVAIVGAGPAGMYAAAELLRHRRVRIDIFERLPEPGGLVRYGVAPDEAGAERMLVEFASVATDPRVRLRLGVEVGVDVTLADLRRRWHAVVFATGGGDGRRLDVPGAGLPGNITGHDLAAWANGHPAHRHRRIDLSRPRAVIIGNGNVALDAARLLSARPGEFAWARLPAHVRNTLARNAIRRITVVGRGGPAATRFTAPALRALLRHDRIRRGGLRFRFDSTPVQITGTARVAGLIVASPGGERDHLDAGLVVHAVGAERPVPVAETGVYAVGAAGGEPVGKIGTNRACAQATVRALIGDFLAGRSL